jgi:hypothetical protein
VNQRGWLVAYWTLFVAFLGTAALNMLHLRGGFLTNHAADLVVPAWLYVASRGLHSRNGRQTLMQRTLGQTPERAALVLFLASTLTEVSQFYWPRGLFPGRFDALDVLAYAVGLAICYVLDRRSLSRAERVAAKGRARA